MRGRRTQKQARYFALAHDNAFHRVTYLDFDFDDVWSPDEDTLTQPYIGQSHELREEKVNGLQY